MLLSGIVWYARRDYARRDYARREYARCTMRDNGAYNTPQVHWDSHDRLILLKPDKIY